jgi:hypothetical protein
MDKYFKITEVQIKMINILIKTVEESINRKTFSEDEVKNILKTIKILNSYPNIH